MENIYRNNFDYDGEYMLMLCGVSYVFSIMNNVESQTMQTELQIVKSTKRKAKKNQHKHQKLTEQIHEES